MSLVLLKFLHVLAFTLGIGGAVANAIFRTMSRRAAPEARAVVGRAARRVTQLASLGLLVLWITGPLLVGRAYGGFAGLPAAFHYKMAAVLLLTGFVLALNFQAIRADRGGAAPPAALMAALGAGTALTGIAAIWFAVLAFGG